MLILVHYVHIYIYLYIYVLSRLKVSLASRYKYFYFLLSISLFVYSSLLFITGCTNGCICAMYIIAHIIHMHVTAVIESRCFRWFAPRMPVALMYAAHAPSRTTNANVVPQNPILFSLSFSLVLSLSLLNDDDDDDDDDEECTKKSPPPVFSVVVLVVAVYFFFFFFPQKSAATKAHNKVWCLCLYVERKNSMYSTQKATLI